MKGKKARWLIPGTAFIIIILVILGLGRSFVSSTQKDVDDQNKQYLTEFAVQSARTVKNMVDMQLDKMEAFANIIGSEQNFSVDYTMQVLSAEARRSSFKRLAYIAPDGEAVTTDHKSFDAHDRTYFKKAMEGKSNVSNVISDKVGGGRIIVYAVPIDHDGVLEGVIISIADVDIFTDAMGGETFCGEGNSYVVQGDGTLVVAAQGNQKAPKFNNLFEQMRSDGINADRLQKDMSANENGIIECSMDQVRQVGVYHKIGINNWYVVTVVPRKVIYKNADSVMARNRMSAAIIICLLTALCILIILQNYKSNKKLSYLAYVDPVTGGNNLHCFKLLASERIAKGGDSLYMIWIDVDNFQLINDMYGYRDGDDILLAMNQMITDMIPKDAVSGRMNDDNFLCLLECKGEGELLELGNRFRVRFRELLEQQGKHYSVSFTTGIYQIKSGETDIDRIINRTIMAHRKAKQMNRERKYCFYSADMRDEAVRIKDIEDVMHQALDKGEFEVYLQPKYNLFTGQMEGAEALVRWNHNGKLLPPSEFIPIFERNGFIVKLDLFMLEEVCRMQRQWLDRGLHPVPVSVNQSKPLVYGKDYAGKVQSIVQRYDLPPYLIEIELLESLIHENIGELKRITDRLHEIGILVCIDDFGSGFSSLNLIKEIQADVLKIDREFLNNAEANARAETVLHNIVELAKGLDMSVVVEGVETEKQAGLLKSVGCCMVQGYLFAEPMPISQYEEKMKES